MSASGKEFLLEEGIEIGEQRGIEIGELRGIEIGRGQGIKATVTILLSLGHSDSEIKSAITKQYGLSENEADNYIK